jgi:hypothetical protein
MILGRKIKNALNKSKMIAIKMLKIPNKGLLTNVPEIILEAALSLIDWVVTLY